MQPYTYFVFQRKKYAPELGEYRSYDIVVYSRLCDGPISILRDVTTDGDLAFRMAERFNRYGLFPIHLKDAVLDMLE